jgi:hypothetical protein
MKREAQKTNKTVVAELELEAPFSAKQKGVLHCLDVTCTSRQLITKQKRAAEFSNPLTKENCFF